MSRVRTGHGPADWLGDTPGAPVTRAIPALGRSTDDIVALFSGNVGITARGMLHRANALGAVHPRCTGGRRFDVMFVGAREAAEWAIEHPSALCRYRWCFRDVVVALGLIPETGHMDRHVRLARALAQRGGRP